MPNRFEIKDIRILIVGISSSMRQVITSVLKDLGYKNLIGVASFKAALEIIETNPVDWVYTPIYDGADGNLLQLLTILNKFPELRHIKVSCYNDNKQNPIIAKCFELGLFSIHHIEMTIAEVTREVRGILESLGKNEGNFAKVSAEFLRKHLNTIDTPAEAIQFEKSFQVVYPGDTDSLLSLAENQFLNGDDDAAKKTIYQVSLIDPDNPEVSQILKHFTGSDELNREEQSVIAAALGLNTCLVIEPNARGAETIKKLIAGMGFKEVVFMDTPLKALPWLRSHDKPDLIISEWQLPNLPGPVFLYKLRNRIKCESPLMVMNEDITEREYPMIQELSAYKIISKPIDPIEFQRSVIWTIKEFINPQDPRILKYKLKQALSGDDPHRVRRLKAALMNNPRITQADKEMAEAEIAYETGCLNHARKHAMNAIHHGGPAPEAMELLGRTLMKLREFDAALRCLQNCALVYPMNVDHLCNIAECHLENGNSEKFNIALDQAKSIDNNERVAETEAKGAIQMGHLDTARKLLERLQSFKEILAYTNNRAVSLIRCGKFDEGIALYQQSIESLPEHKRELESLVRYNLALAYTRNNDLENALIELKKGEKCKNRERRLKITSLKKRIINSIEKGKPLVLKSSAPPTEEQEAEKLKVYHQLERDLKRLRTVTRSDFCLYKIYQTRLGDELAEKLLKKVPTFKFRGKIHKDYHGIRQVPA